MAYVSRKWSGFAWRMVCELTGPEAGMSKGEAAEDAVGGFEEGGKDDAAAEATGLPKTDDAPNNAALEAPPAKDPPLPPPKASSKLANPLSDMGATVGGGAE